MNRILSGLIVYQRDWIMAAEQSHRNIPDEQRNKDTFDQFMEAEDMELKAQNKN